jgi:hypothetical protein
MSTAMTIKAPIHTATRKPLRSSTGQVPPFHAGQEVRQQQGEGTLSAHCSAGNRRDLVQAQFDPQEMIDKMVEIIGA